MDKVIPELGVSDMQRSIEFYSRLGLDKSMEGTIDDKGLQWCQMDFGESKLWLQRQDVDPDFRAGAPVGNGVTVCLRVDDVGATYDNIRKAGYEINITHPLETMWYGLREFKLCDPDGYNWTFYTPTDEATTEGAGSDA